MKKLRILFIVALVFLIRVMLSVAFKRIPAHHWMVYLSVGSVVVLGLLITLKMWVVSRELDSRLESLASLRRTFRELDHIRISLGDSNHNHMYIANESANATTVTRIQVSEEQKPVPAYPGGQTDLDASRFSNDSKSDPESRLARVLKDDYPL